jgi:hypothetical protein
LQCPGLRSDAAAPPGRRSAEIERTNINNLPLVTLFRYDGLGAPFPPRAINLRDPTDRQALMDYLAPDPELSALARNHLDDYLRYFEEPAWSQMFLGAHIMAPGARGGWELRDLLDCARRLRNLAGLLGFEDLLVGLRNPTQVHATMFEIETADWCLARSVTQGIEFGVNVAARGDPRKPEFLWHTTLGDLFVECKQAALFESALRARVDRFTEVVRTAIGGAESVPEDLRLDVFVRLPARNGIDLRIARAVKDALDRAALGEAASYEEVTATLRARAVDLDRPYGTVRSFLPAPNTSLIHATSAYSSLVVEAEPYYERVAATLIRRARDQLPRDGIGAVFVRTLHTMRAIARANALLAQTAYERTPWISLVSSGISVPMWRPDQPFDNRLLEERPPLSVHSAQHRRPRV